MMRREEPRRVVRIAFARINQETNALSPVTTTLADFAATHLVTDAAELLRRCESRTAEVEGMFRNAELSGFVQRLARRRRRDPIVVTPVPLLSAWAVPSGPLARACFDSLVGDLCERLAQACNDGGIDAVYLSLHGAMNVVDLPLPDGDSADGEIVRRVREVIGDQVPLAVSLDLHGNLTRGLVERSTFVQAYQTNPHRDHAAVGARCADVLVDTLLCRVKPVLRWRSLPMILGGGNTIDFLPPLSALFRRLKALQRDRRVLGASLLPSHPWNAHPELGWGILVATDAQTDTDGAFADRAADELATRAWAVRDRLPPAFSSPTEAIARARRRRFLRKTGVVVFSDASDVVTAGAPGENTALLRALAQATDLVSYATVRDPVLVDDLFRRHRAGDRVDVSIGGKLDPARNTAFAVSAQLRDLREAPAVGRMAVLTIGTLELVVVEGPAIAVRPAYYQAAGLRPFDADVIVVKNFFPFLLFFAPLMRDVVFVKTGGVTDFDAAFSLPFAGPVHPRDDVAEWRTANQRRHLAPVLPVGTATTTRTKTASGARTVTTPATPRAKGRPEAAPVRGIP
jgi:microcystin degradation protein MlrC